MNFVEFPKMARLSRECVVTEKIDGTNASVYLSNDVDEINFDSYTRLAVVDGLGIWAGSRTRWVTPNDDNFGWASWVKEHAEELAKLGPGHHFGEWWGKGIQRGYGLTERRFSLFNVGRWKTICSEAPGLEPAPGCCGVVPILARLPSFDSWAVDSALELLRANGSVAAPGFMDPEGVVVFHTAANLCFKKTLGGDGHKGLEKPREKKEKPAKERKPFDPNVSGRRKGCEGYQGPKRRSTDGV